MKIKLRHIKSRVRAFLLLYIFGSLIIIYELIGPTSNIFDQSASFLDTQQRSRLSFGVLNDSVLVDPPNVEIINGQPYCWLSPYVICSDEPDSNWLTKTSRLKFLDDPKAARNIISSSKKVDLDTAHPQKNIGLVHSGDLAHRFVFGGQCEEFNNCEWVTEDSTMDNRNTVMFTQSPSKDHLQPHQIFVYVTQESLHDESPDLFDGSVLTMTYRTDSYIFYPYAYLKHNPKPHITLDYYISEAKSKDLAILWIVSHCKTQSDRERYVEELKKYISVDTYGVCGDSSIPRNGDGGLTMGGLNASRYHFYLSFESTLCTDYITEKFFKAIAYNLVPVVRGGGDRQYKTYFPHKSFISTGDFNSPKELAGYLNHLLKDMESYSRYLQVIDQYDVIWGHQLESRACQLCKVLNTINFNTPTYNNKTSQWFKTPQCQDPRDNPTSDNSSEH